MTSNWHKNLSGVLVYENFKNDQRSFPQEEGGGGEGGCLKP